MEEEQPPIDNSNIDTTNKYLTFIKNNKYSIYFIGAIVILLILIISMVTIIALSSSTKKTSITSTTSPTQSPTGQETSQTPSTPSISPISPSVSAISITTPDPTQAVAIENQTQPQITPGNVPFTYSNIKLFGNNWATADLTNPNTQGGAIIMQNVNGSWKVIAGPGSFFPHQYLQSLGVPQSVMDSFIPSSSPVPSQ